MEGCEASRLGSPQPAQYVRGEHCDSGSGGDTGKRLLRAGFSMREAVTANHDGNQTGDLRDRAGEEVLQRGEPAIERRTGLRICGDGKEEAYGRKQREWVYPSAQCLERLQRDYDSDLSRHRHLQRLVNQSGYAETLGGIVRVVQYFVAIADDA